MHPRLRLLAAATALTAGAACSGAGDPAGGPGGAPGASRAAIEIMDFAFEVAGVLRWTRHGRTLEELDGFNQLLAIFETGAHLDLLAAQGRVVRELVDGVLRYR